MIINSAFILCFSSAGAPIKGQMCVTQVLRVPPVKPPSSSQDKDREEDGTVTVAMPSGLKERWKPFGWSKSMLVYVWCMEDCYLPY